MNFKQVIRLINKVLREDNPKEFSSSWILRHAPQAYHYIRLNLRTEIGQIDWDRVTVFFDKKFQKRWVRYKRKKVKEYRNKAEIDKVLKKHKDKLYIFITALSEEDKVLRHNIAIALVRTAQKGNVLAKQELIKLLDYIVKEWVDKYYFLNRWKAYETEIEAKIESCIRNYKYTGSFMGYLFRTLQYSALALRPLYSLDECAPNTDMMRHETIGQDLKTGEIRMFRR